MRIDECADHTTAKRQVVGAESNASPVTANVSWPEYDSIHNPHEYFAARGWHAITVSGAWDFDKMMGELPLTFSDAVVSSRKKSEMKFWNLGFHLEDKTVVSLQRRGAVESVLRLWAPSLEQARNQLAALRPKYLRRSKRRPSTTSIIVLSARPDLETRSVSVKIPVRTLDQVEVNYGVEFAKWSESFLSTLKSEDSGLSIFFGEAGTGKTTFARYIAHRLRHSHRFYYVPLDLFSTLTGPRAMDFWLTQNAVYEKAKKVLLIEDAEPLLIHRAETEANISDVLNLADGFLGDVLQLHVICTTNASIDCLDPAVIRPGRLVANKEFRRLSWPEAARLAQSRGLVLKRRESYSLAEVYNDNSLGDNSLGTRKSIGFGTV